MKTIKRTFCPAEHLCRCALIDIEVACETLLTHLDDLTYEQRFSLFKSFEESYWAYVAYKNTFDILHKEI